ncbi:TadE/TadG family type IV pilus assembly protein [Roseobacter sp.]|uniref:TadE/TadG family type IV pilus assembly protein n=1 Tax=Roseobacter sp. TaxID=1907202 RepID=UPI00385B55CF
MTSYLKAAQARLMEFAQREDGNVTLEFVIVCPLMFWTHLAMYTYFDAFREQTINQKAAFTVADLISRQAAVNAAFIDGSHAAFDTLVRSNSDTSIRVTSVEYDQDEDEYTVLWSQARGDFPTLTSDDLQNGQNYLPVMYDTATVIVVETASEFVPAFNIGLSPRTFTNFTFTRPRYSPKVEWEPNIS